MILCYADYIAQRDIRDFEGCPEAAQYTWDGSPINSASLIELVDEDAFFEAPIRPEELRRAKALELIEEKYGSLEEAVAQLMENN